MTSRASKFLDAMRAIEEACRTIEELEDDGLFGYQRDEVIAAKMSIQQAAERLAAVANLRGDAA